MLMLLARHGNTFSPGQKVVWVGAKNDLPLVESGILQAKHLAEHLLKHKIFPSQIYAGPLQRSRHYAELIMRGVGKQLQIKLDPRLDEIDYGSWSGLSDAEIAGKYGASALAAWNNLSQRPQTADWQPGEAVIRAEVASMLDELQNNAAQETVLLVSSNGRLRYFCEALGGKISQGKMKTGHLSAVLCKDGKSELLFWDAAPEKISALADHSL